MKPSLRLLCGVLLTAFTLSGCAEQILDSASKDPAPTVTSGEEGTANTIAKFSTPEGLAPQPSDVVLANVNAALPPEVQLAGISRLMPIRIPFSRPLANLYNDNGSWNAQAGGNLALNLLIFPTSNPTAPVLALPTVGGGTFKVVYQDANNDLVLVPDSSTFQAGTQYAVVVKTSLGDAQGSPLSPDILTNILTNPLPIVVDGKIMNSLFDDLDTANSLEGLRASYAPLIGGLQALGQIESHNDLAQLFTFTTEVEDLDAANDIALAFDAIEANLTDTTSAYSDNITWATTYPSSPDTLVDQPLDLKTDVVKILDSNLPSDNVSTLYKGYFSCLNFLSKAEDGWELDLPNRASNPLRDCPSGDNSLNGKIGFWISNPATVDGIIIYLHGLEQNKEEMFAVMDTFASKNIVTVAIDIWGHGERTYLDANGNGSLDSNDSLIITTRYDNPSLTAGYIIQTQFDLLRLRTLLEANLNIRTAIVGSVSEMPPIYFVGHSLGSFVGSNFANTGFPIDGAVISSSGGDISDIGLNGNYRDDILGLIALGLGIDPTTKTGKELLNSTALGLELTMAHGLFKGGIDPLVTASSSAATPLLLQQIKGGMTVPNSNSKLLALAMGLPTYTDGDDFLEGVNRSHWILHPDSYKEGVADHSFFLDWESEATLRGQQQAACFLATGKVLDPSKVIDITTCTNTNAN